MRWKKIWREGKLVPIEILRKAEKEEGYGPGHFHIKYLGKAGLYVNAVVHECLLH